MRNKNYYVIDGVTYTKRGWAGCQLESRERGLKKGDTRVIKDQLFYVAFTQSFWEISMLGLGKPEVSWCMYFESQTSPTNEQVREFYKRLEIASS